MLENVVKFSTNYYNHIHIYNKEIIYNKEKATRVRKRVEISSYNPCTGLRSRSGGLSMRMNTDAVMFILKLLYKKTV